MKLVAVIVVLIAILTLGTACGEGATPTPSPTTAPTATRMPPTATPGPPDEASKHTSDGAKLVEEEKYEDAIKEFDQAIEIYPDYAEAFNRRGVAYLYLGQNERAIQDFRSHFDVL